MPETEIVVPMIIWTRIAADAPPVMVPSRMYWQAKKPLEVCVVFNSPGYATDDDDSDDVRWVFGRDLVTQALRDGIAGEGDVTIEISHGLLVLHLTSPFGEITLRTEAVTVTDFIRQTFAAVDQLTEADWLPLDDAALRAWLEGA